MIKVCKQCGKLFETTSSRQSYCSITCRTEHQKEVDKDKSHKPTRICEWCGKKFTPKTNTQKYCKDIHYQKCIVCGKEFIIDLSKQDKRKTCSTECYNKYKFHNGNPFSNPESRIKAKQTMIDRYGVDHPMKSEEILNKQKQTMVDRYGVEHYAQSDEYVEQAKKTNNERYGVDWAIQNSDILEKRNDTMRERYGTSNPMQVSELVEKKKQSMLDTYGVAYPLQSEEIQTKMQITNKSRYGVTSYSQTPEFKDKFKQTMLDRYGVENPGYSEEILSKTKETNLKRYGSECYLSSTHNRNKLKSTMNERYGVDSYSKTKYWKIARMIDPTKVDNWLKFLDNPESFISSTYKEKPNYHQLETDLGVSDSTISYHINVRGLQNLVKFTLSSMEDDVTSMLSSIYPELLIQRHCRNIIKPYELDIYLPQYNIAIECNPTATHNSSRPFIDIDILSTNYHQMKTNLCDNVGVQLFHIFGYEWTHKRPIIESMLRNMLGKSIRKVFARNTIVKEVSAADVRKFLNENHRQGFASSSVKLGLYIEDTDELVSLMTFGKIRNTIGTGNDNNDGWELVRFCNLLNTNVVGGASKLFNHFIRTYDPERIISFSDRAHTSGKLYSILGFTEIRRSDPGYVWVDIMNDKAYHRTNAQKSNIRKFLHDDTIDLSKSEKQIMEEFGFVIVYDSGTITWEWRNI